MSYRELLLTIDAWFATGVRAAGAGLVPCRSGCTACCHGPFDISAADARLVAEAVTELPRSIRSGIEARAVAQLGRGQQVEPGWQHPWPVDLLGDDAFDRIADAQAQEPCPALDPDSGTCLIHSSRPATCRITGLSMLTAEKDILENVCPIQDQFPGYTELAATPFDLMRFELTAAEHDLAAMEVGWQSTTVAGVVGRT